MTRQHQTLGTLLEAHENSFNVVRLAAAAMVIVSHSFALVGGSNLAQPLSWGPFNLGSIAVNVFFVLSGVMLSRSFDQRPDWRAFTAARVLRIFPGLIVSGVVTALVVGPFFSDETLAVYLAETHALLYPILGILGGHAHVDFAGSPFPDELNSSLWTIKYELLSYFIFGVASALGVLKSRFVATCATVLLGVGLVLVVRSGPLEGSVADNVVRFGFCFALGAMLYRFRDSVRVRPLAAPVLVAVALPLGTTPIGPLAWVVVSAYAAIALAGVRVPGLTRFANRWDISFGVYLYGWPIQQMLMGMPGAQTSTPIHIALALLGASAVGWLSFVLVERPAMRQRDVVASILGRATGSRSAAPAPRDAA